MKFNCPHCQKALNVKDELAGKKGKCPFCGQALVVPAPAEEEITLVPLGEEYQPEPSGAGDNVDFEGMAKDIGETYISLIGLGRCLKILFPGFTGPTLESQSGETEAKNHILAYIEKFRQIPGRYGKEYLGDLASAASTQAMLHTLAIASVQLGPLVTLTLGGNERTKHTFIQFIRERMLSDFMEQPSQGNTG